MDAISLLAEVGIKKWRICRSIMWKNRQSHAFPNAFFGRSYGLCFSDLWPRGLSHGQRLVEQIGEFRGKVFTFEATQTVGELA